MSQYIPENNYLQTNYTPIKGYHDDLCTRCENYYAHLLESGLTKVKFPPRCEKHIQNRILGLTEKDFSNEQEYQEAIILSDPISWAQGEFGWEARFYQNDMLSCTSKYKLYRCLAPETPILMANGSWKKIIDIKIGDTVVSRNELNQKVLKKVVTYWDNGKKQLYKIKLENGLELRLTEDHPLWAHMPSEESYSTNHAGYGGVAVSRRVFSSQWASIKSGLKIGTKIKVINDYQIFGSLSKEKEAIFLGYMLTDGYFGTNNQTPKFTGNNLLYHKELQEIVKLKFGYDCKEVKRQESLAFDTYLTDGNKGTKNKVSAYFKELDLLGTKKDGKRIPNLLYEFDKKSICLFINRIFAGDGCAYATKLNKKRPNSGELKLTSISYDLLDEIRLILLKMDIHSRIKLEEKESVVTEGKLNKSFNLIIADGMSIINFFNNIGLIYGKEEQSQRLLNAANNKRYLTRETGGKNYRWSKIVSIEKDEYINVYDIEVEGTHNFIANGIVSKNCGRRLGKTEALVVETLHHVVTNKNNTVLVIAPYERQVTRFFDEINKFISKGTTIGGSLSRYTKTPSRMDFNNGSRILGFSAGATSASGSDKIRGQDAHLIIIDEIDTLEDKDIDAVMAILASHKECKLVAATTPRGWRRRFYTYCTDKNLGFKEFWFVSAESPEWDDKAEAFFKGTTDTTTYTHEYLADFAELEEGVFKGRYINASLQTYDITTIEPQPNCDYVLGVDWNKSAGTHMVIMEHYGSKLRMVKKVIIEESTYTQTDAVDLIISLNRKWRFKYIFVDAGYGSVQTELLRKHTLVEPSSMLDQKLYAIAMNQHLEVLDPLSGEPVKRNAKHFLIEQTRKLIEDGNIILPKSEDTAVSASNVQMGVVQQMRNFRVEAVSVYGLPRYSQGQDHTLTAFYLACGGYYWKEGDLKSVPYVNHIIGLEVSDEVNQNIHPSVLERQQDLSSGWKLIKTTSKHQMPKSAKSRELGVDSLLRSKKFNNNRRGPNNSYRRGNF